MPEPFAETNAVVTGASSGIGAAIAVALAGVGVKRMIVHYRANADGAQQTCDRVAELGCEATAIAADLACPQDVDRLAESAFEGLGVIQTWVNNAGADVLTGETANASFDEKLTTLLATDVQGTIRLSRQVAPKMVAQAVGRPGSMVFIGWDQAPLGMEGDAGQMFGPVKAAVMAYAASLAQSYAPELRVNTVAPGWIRTSWGESTSDYWDQRAQGQSLMSRWGKPEDVASAVLYLANPDNTFLTGQTVAINGGWNRRFLSPGE